MSSGDLVSRVRRMSAAATMMMGKTERDETVAAVQALEEENRELRAERDALLRQPLDLSEMDSIDEDASGKMVAYYWWQQAQEARAALKGNNT